MGRTGVKRRRLNDEMAVLGETRTSMVVAGREPAKQNCSTGMSPRTETDHDVSILITIGDVAGR
jgi:hypothetical protein